MFVPAGPSHWGSQIILYLHIESRDKSDDELLYLFFIRFFFENVYEHIHICMCNLRVLVPAEARRGCEFSRKLQFQGIVSCHVGARN